MFQAQDIFVQRVQDESERRKNEKEELERKILIIEEKYQNKIKILEIKMFEENDKSKTLIHRLKMENFFWRGRDCKYVQVVFYRPNNFVKTKRLFKNLSMPFEIN